MKDEINKMYQNVAPSEELIQSTLMLIKKQKRKQELPKLLIRCVAAAAACIIFSLVYADSIAIKELPEGIASVFSNGKPVVIFGGLFAILCVLFITIFFKNRKK